MGDLIDRQAAIAHAVPLNLFGREVMMVSVSELENLPSAQPERKKGRWKVTPVYIKCSECGESFMLIPQNYCPNCGADMRGEDNG